MIRKTRVERLNDPSLQCFINFADKTSSFREVMRCSNAYHNTRGLPLGDHESR